MEKNKINLNSNNQILFESLINDLSKNNKSKSNTNSILINDLNMLINKFNNNKVKINNKYYNIDNIDYNKFNETYNSSYQTLKNNETNNNIIDNILLLIKNEESSITIARLLQIINIFELGFDESNLMSILKEFNIPVNNSIISKEDFIIFINKIL